MWALAKGLLRKVAPAAISWGINKLANTSVVKNHVLPFLGMDEVRKNLPLLPPPSKQFNYPQPPQQIMEEEEIVRQVPKYRTIKKNRRRRS